MVADRRLAEAFVSFLRGPGVTTGPQTSYCLDSELHALFLFHFLVHPDACALPVGARATLVSRAWYTDQFVADCVRDAAILNLLSRRRARVFYCGAWVDQRVMFGLTLDPAKIVALATREPALRKDLALEHVVRELCRFRREHKVRVPHFVARWNSLQEKEGQQVYEHCFEVIHHLAVEFSSWPQLPVTFEYTTSDDGSGSSDENESDNIDDETEHGDGGGRGGRAFRLRRKEARHNKTEERRLMPPPLPRHRMSDDTVRPMSWGARVAPRDGRVAPLRRLLRKSRIDTVCWTGGELGQQHLRSSSSSTAFDEDDYLKWINEYQSRLSTLQERVRRPNDAADFALDFKAPANSNTTKKPTKKRQRRSSSQRANSRGRRSQGGQQEALLRDLGLGDDDSDGDDGDDDDDVSTGDHVGPLLHINNHNKHSNRTEAVAGQKKRSRRVITKLIAQAQATDTNIVGRHASDVRVPVSLPFWVGYEVPSSARGDDLAALCSLWMFQDDRGARYEEALAAAMRHPEPSRPACESRFAVGVGDTEIGTAEAIEVRSEPRGDQVQMDVRVAIPMNRHMTHLVASETLQFILKSLSLAMCIGWVRMHQAKAKSPSCEDVSANNKGEEEEGVARPADMWAAALALAPQFGVDVERMKRRVEARVPVSSLRSSPAGPPGTLWVRGGVHLPATVENIGKLLAEARTPVGQ